MKPFFGNIGDVIVVKENTPDKNIELLKQLYPNTRIVKKLNGVFEDIVKEIEETPKYVLLDKTLKTNEELKNVIYEDGIFKPFLPKSPEVIVRVNEELTDEEKKVFLQLYPGATILVEKK